MEMEFDEYHDVCILIDASNVCWNAALSESPSSSSADRARVRPPLRGLVICINFFLGYYAKGARIQAVAPNWWGRVDHMLTDDQIAFEQLIENQILILAPERTHDDLYILFGALRDGRTAIVTNDLFRDHQVNFGLSKTWYEERRVGFTFVGDRFDIDIEKLKIVLGEKPISTLSFSLPEKWEPAQKEDSIIPMEKFTEMVEVDPQLLGRMIGQGGARIKRIQIKYGTEISVRDNKVIFSSLDAERLFWARTEFCSVNRPTVAEFNVPARSSLAKMEIEQRTELDIIQELRNQRSMTEKVQSDNTFRSWTDVVDKKVHEKSAQNTTYSSSGTDSSSASFQAGNIASLDLKKGNSSTLDKVLRPNPADIYRNGDEFRGSFFSANKVNHYSPNLAPLDMSKTRASELSTKPTLNMMMLEATASTTRFTASVKPNIAPLDLSKKNNFV